MSKAKPKKDRCGECGKVLDFRWPGVTVRSPQDFTLICAQHATPMQLELGNGQRAGLAPGDGLP